MNHDLICLFQARALLHMIHLRVAIRRLCRATLCCCPPCRCRAARLATTTLPALPPPHCLPCHHRTARLATAALPTMLPAALPTTLPTTLPPHCQPHCHHTAHLATTMLRASLPTSPPLRCP